MLLFFASLKSIGNTYYFSTLDGDDSRTSTEAQNPASPWKTINKLNSFFASLLPGDQVLFKRGDVFYTNTGITCGKSGALRNMITFGAYGTGAKPIITGLQDVTGWTNTGRNLWESNIITDGQASAMIVTIGGVNYPMGRYPNADDARGNGGYLTYESHSGINSITDNQLPATPNWTGAWVVVRKDTWVIDRGYVNLHSGNTIIFTPVAGNNNKGVSGAGYFIENDVKTLDEQGEWYYDPSAKKLTVYWRETPPVTQISTSKQLVTGNGRSFLTFDNLVFRGSIARMIDINNNHWSFTNDDLINAGEDGIWCSDIANLDVENCTFTNINNNGMTGSNVAGVTVKHCSFTNIGMYPGMSNQRSGHSCEGVRLFGDTNANITVNYCTFRNIGYNAIDFQGSNVLIRGNFIDSTHLIKSDGGSIYTWTSRDDITNYTNRVIDSNLCMHALGALNGSANVANDSLIDANIYLDDYTRNTIVTNNFCYRAARGIYCHNAYDDSLGGNIVFDNRYAGLYFRNDGHAINIAVKKNMVVERNPKVVCYRYRSSSNDIATSGNADSNYYARPIYDNKIIQTEFPNGILHTLSGFQSSFTTREQHSHNSSKRITNLNDPSWLYNVINSSINKSTGINYQKLYQEFMKVVMEAF